MYELSLFAGAGGGILAGKLLGWRTICAVEIDPYCRNILMQRQNDGILEPFPIWDDIRTFDGKPWAGKVDVISGGFPCQDISSAGKGAGIDGSRSGLWSEMARIIGEVRPQYVFVENSPLLVRRGLARVLGDLASLGYDAKWGIVGADDAGAPHRRKRIWILANSHSPCGEQPEAEANPGTRSREGRNAVGRRSEDVANTSRGRRSESEKPKNQQPRGTEIKRASQDDAHTKGDRCGQGRQGRPDSGGQGKFEQALQDVADADGERGRTRSGWKNRKEAGNGWEHVPSPNKSGLQGPMRESRSGTQRQSNGYPPQCSWWLSEPRLGRVAHGVANRVDRLKAIGNGQVPAVAQLAWKILKF